MYSAKAFLVLTSPLAKASGNLKEASLETASSISTYSIISPNVKPIFCMAQFTTANKYNEKGR
jgi:hypothetical protein